MIDLSQLSSEIASALAAINYPARPEGLYQPVQYTLASGGKRLRPALCLAACQALCGDAKRAVNQALAIEMFHNFTLIHDDVMDGSDTRRGRPTVFAKWGDVQAILSGDALLTMATMRLCSDAGNRLPDLLQTFNETAMGVYEGQQFDMDFEDRDDVTIDEYIEMIRLKTSVLLGGALMLGAIMADADTETRRALYEYGENLGLAFQLRDDWLDTFGDLHVFGKPIGGDIVNRKKTWLFITAMNEDPAAMAHALTDNPGRADLVAAVTEVYNSLNLSERCDALVGEYCDKAVNALNRTAMSDDDRSWFADLARNLCSRQS